MARLNSQLVWWLERWGEWTVSGCSGLGYPTMTAEHRLMVSPGKATMLSPAVPLYRQDKVARRVDTAMREIPDKDWRLLALCYALRCSYGEIARQLELSGRSTAFNQVIRAHKPVDEQLRIPLYR